MQKIMTKVAAVLTSAALCAGLVACSSSEDADEGSTETEVASKEEEAGGEFQETVLVETDEFTITATGFVEREEGDYGLAVATAASEFLENYDADYGIALTIVNNSETETYEFTSYYCAVNGIEVYCYLNEEVAPGETVESWVVFYDDEGLQEQEEMGVEFDFTDVDLRLTVYEADDGNQVFYTHAHFYPYGESAASTFEFEMEDDYETLIDNDSLTVILVGQGEDEDGNYALYFYAENKTDMDMELYATDEYVNGESASAWGWTEVGAGHAAFGSVYWRASTLEDLGISDVSDIESIDFVLAAYAESYSEGVITFTFGDGDDDEAEESEAVLGTEAADATDESDETSED